MSRRNLLLIAVAVAVSPAALPAQGAFGSGIAMSGGGREVVVGQPGNAYGPGVVYIYTQDAKGAWTAAKKLTRSGATNGDGFGSAVALDAGGNSLLVGSEK